MTSIFKEYSRVRREYFQTTRKRAKGGCSYWKSLKNINKAGGAQREKPPGVNSLEVIEKPQYLKGVQRAILRMGLAPPWGGAVPALVERAKQWRIIHAW